MFEGSLRARGMFVKQYDDLFYNTIVVTKYSKYTKYCKLNFPGEYLCLLLSALPTLFWFMYFWILFSQALRVCFKSTLLDCLDKFVT